MTTRPQSAIARRIATFLQSTLPFWPAESREWGRAMAAEAAQIHATAEAIRWALGGFAFFLRSIGSHFWTWANLPAGANSPSILSANEPPILPKRSRLTTVLLFATALTLLSLPSGRAAVTSISEIWFSSSDLETRRCEELAAIAQKEKDAHSLALVATVHPDTKRGMQLASQAVALDPSLTWIYTSPFGGAHTNNLALPAPWLSALHSYDLQNGFPFLLAADDRANAVFSAVILDHSPQVGELDHVLAKDVQWRQLMRKAALSSKFDDYQPQRRALARETLSGRPSFAPGLVLYSVWRSGWPNLSLLQSYAKLEVQEAQQAAARGDLLAAESSLNELRDFGERLASAQQADVTRLGGIAVSRESLLALRSLYLGQIRLNALQSLNLELADLDRRHDALVHGHRQAFLTLIPPYKRAAFGVHLIALLLMVIALALAASMVFLESSVFLPGIRRRYAFRAAYIVASYAPLLLPAVALALLLSFRPFALALSRFRLGTTTFADESNLTVAYWQLVWAFGDFSAALFDPLRFWWFTTIGLTALAILITVRGLLRRLPA